MGAAVQLGAGIGCGVQAAGAGQALVLAGGSPPPPAAAVPPPAAMPQRACASGRRPGSAWPASRPATTTSCRPTCRCGPRLRGLLWRRCCAAGRQAGACAGLCCASAASRCGAQAGHAWAGIAAWLLPWRPCARCRSALPCAAPPLHPAGHFQPDAAHREGRRGGCGAAGGWAGWVGVECSRRAGRGARMCITPCAGRHRRSCCRGRAPRAPLAARRARRKPCPASFPAPPGPRVLVHGGGGGGGPRRRAGVLRPRRRQPRLHQGRAAAPGAAAAGAADQAGGGAGARAAGAAGRAAQLQGGDDVAATAGAGRGAGCVGCRTPRQAGVWLPACLPASWRLKPRGPPCAHTRRQLPAGDGRRRVEREHGGGHVPGAVRQRGGRRHRAAGHALCHRQHPEGGWARVVALARGARGLLRCACAACAGSQGRVRLPPVGAVSAGWARKPSARSAAAGRPGPLHPPLRLRPLRAPAPCPPALPPSTPAPRRPPPLRLARSWRAPAWTRCSSWCSRGWASC